MKRNLDQSAISARAWEHGWHGHERQQQRRLAALSLSEKLAWLEEAQRLVDQLRTADRVRSESKHDH